MANRKARSPTLLTGAPLTGAASAASAAAAAAAAAAGVSRKSRRDGEHERDEPPDLQVENLWSLTRRASEGAVEGVQAMDS